MSARSPTPEARYPLAERAGGCLSILWRKPVGSVRIEGQHLVCEVDGEVRLDLGRQVGVNVAFWPRDKRKAWVSVSLGQGSERVEVQTLMPWSAVPPDAAMLESSAPYCGPRHFEGLWSQIVFLQSTVGPPLPQIAPGTYQTEPRFPAPIPEPEPEPKRRKARLRDMKLVGTKDAIFTFGINTRGFIVFGINAYGVVVVGMNAFGVVVIGGNAASVLSLGFNVVSPLALTGFNVIALLMLLPGFNDPLTLLAESFAWALVPVAMIMAAGFVAAGRKLLKAARDAEEKAGPNDDLAPALIHRWIGYGYILGAPFALALSGLLVALPLETIRAPFLKGWETLLAFVT